MSNTSTPTTASSSSTNTTNSFASSIPPLLRSDEDQKAIETLLNGRTTNLPFTVNALQVVARRYVLRTHDNEVTESPEEMFERVARHLAKVESRYGASPSQVEAYAREFFDIMADFKFTPAGRTLTNAGGPTLLVANCIVLHIEDSMDHIFRTLSEAALLQQAGSGLGFPLHLLRPAGEITKRSFGVASGPISFLHVYNTAFGVIKQQNRHGANMAVMSVDHPDILEFIHCKDVEGNLKNFNVSVGLTDRFMEAVSNDDPSPWRCYWNDKEYSNVRSIKRDANMCVLDIEETQMTARQLFMEIVNSAWKTGEPGCVFLDTVNKVNPLPGLGRIHACNPCGEQQLHDGDVCNLGSLNLEKFVDTNRRVQYDELKRVTRLAVRLLDNVIDVSEFPVDRVNKTARNNRRVGLGIMGFADMLYRLRVPYNSEEGRNVGRKVMTCIQEAAEEMSEQLAEAKGVFPNWDKSVFAPKGIRRRNAALTNIAPTGSIAMMFNISGGVEPYFALAYHYRNVLGGNVQLQYFNKHLEEALREAGCYSQAVVDEIERRGSLQKIDAIPEKIKRVFVTSMDISAKDHILMQSAMQENCDNAISKTINFPNSATRQDILQGYLLAWKHKCKGCTVYRDGSRFAQVLNLNDTDDATDDQPVDDDVVMPVAESSSAATKRVADQDAKNLEASDNKKHKTLSVAKAQRPKNQCPDCQDYLVLQEGCCLCHSCGYSACSRV
mmetsp:Transcript_18687/g.27826  ORF Transcript_18687/g.27826 Transcript_18687/m.27826 type:complete len:723 (+) Transcript_18687:69-2237(+)